MASVIVRNLTDETHRALKARAHEHGRSMEAEIRAILDEAIEDQPRRGLGTLLSSIRQESGGVDLDITRDRSVYEPLDLS
ncbi:MAG: Plasmid stability protein StbC [Actinomyces urogenitalis DORA_12]|uniref:Plasmid stability protein StbC n=1 Tax=Actinomyces urogenitalis DORA_12 TaxID=1403939 RepID=W1VTK7_9ACTO|nr:Arc family DNA-binding protein [uncultured Actinomyces sp.]ETJ07434.1 MAG: Plasmid stability protein StbC [Actinomyces urogenitalis DORA_12]